MALSMPDHGATMGLGSPNGPVSSLGARDESGRGLELIFWMQSGRCEHRLVALAETQRVDLLESVEGEVQGRWPSSPPWQQIEYLPGNGEEKQGQAILLTGAAGSGHWSASVERNFAATGSDEQTPGESGPMPGLRFDVACRAGSRPDWLGNTYRLADSRVSVSPVTGHSALEFQTVLGRYRLRVLPGEPMTSEGSPRGPDSCRLVVTDGLIRIVALSDVAEQLPATFRWRYEIRRVV